ncbi:MAG: hypothetical protein SCM11_12505 [Bacillota bacterium]|nr:hypothetical protein [Bacillota bacterium]
MNWYAKSFRRNLIDMHIDDWDETFLSEFDPDQYFDCLRRAHIQSPMIYLQSHVGLCNWDTQSGRTHRAFRDDNKVRRLIDLCHGAGMDVIAYYSLIYNNCAYADHPEWRMLHSDGSPSRSDLALGFMNGGRYGLVCPNQPGYRTFLQQQFAEFCTEYTFEGLFLDMTFWPMVCHCNACRSRYRNESVREIPETVDWQDDRWIHFQLARQRWLGEFAVWCSAEIKKHKPEVAIEHQFSTVCQQWGRGVDEKVNEANDYAGGDLYGGHLEQSYICKIYREATRNQPFEYMTSRCDPFLRVHTTTKTLHDLKLHNYLTLAHHGAFLVIDAIDPVGTINPAVYDRIGQVFQESIPYEPFLTGDLVSEVALIMSYDSKFNYDAKPDNPDQADQSHPQLKAQLGMARILKDLRMTFTVLPNNRLERLQGKKLAILTDAALLRPEEIDTLTDFVAAGGSLYLSGTTDARLAERLLGIRRIGLTQETSTYLAPTNAGQISFGEEYSARYPVSAPGKQVLVTNPLGHSVLATVTLPYTDPEDRSVFASIHSNPPGRPTEYPAVILGRHGKGQVLWLSCALESSRQESLRGVVTRLLTQLAEPSILQSDAPACVELTLFKDEGRYILHAVNVQETSPALPIGAFSIALNIEQAVRQVRSAPCLEPVDFEQTGQGIRFTLPGLDLFETCIIEF